MRQHNKKVLNYSRSVVPEHIPQGIQTEIEDKSDAHVSEKVEHCQTLELNESTSIETALSDMDNVKPVKKRIKKLHFENVIISFLVTIIILLMDFFAMLTGFIYFTVDSGEEPSVIHVFLSAVITCGLMISILFVSRIRRREILIGISIAMLILSLTFIGTSALFQPVVYAIGLSFCYIVQKLFNLSLFDGSYFNETFVVLGAEALNIFFCVISFVGFIKNRKSRICKMPPKRKKQINIKHTAIILTTFTICLTGIFYFAARYYGISQNSTVSTYVAEREIKETKNLYEKIDQNTTFHDADALLHRNGFVTQQEYLDTLPQDQQNSTFTEYDLDSKRNDGMITYYNMDLVLESGFYFNTLHLSKTGVAPITYKSLSMIDRPIVSITGFVKKQKPRACYERFIRLSKGDKKEKVLKQFDNDFCELFSNITQYKNKNVIETFHYSSNDDLISDIHFDLTFKNGVLSEGTLNGTGDDGKYDYEKLGNVTVK